MNIQEFKAEFDGHLEKFLLDKIKQSPAKNKIYSEALKHALKISMSGGKRIRPYLIFLAYNSTQENPAIKIDSRILNLCLSIEIFHIFCLVHDDIMDDDEKRHSQLTLQSFMQSKYKTSKHVAESLAILIGDLYFSYASELISDYPFETKIIFNHMIEEVVYGQFLDMYIENYKNPKTKEVNEKTSLKTANYTFTRPIQLGLSIKNSTKELYPFAESFGHEIGFAYQVQDDYISIFGDSKKTGKNALVDISNGQHTIFTEYIFKSKQASKFKKYFGKVIKNKDHEIIKNIFIESGAVKNGMKIIESKYKKARILLNEQKFSNMNEWNIILDKLEERT